MWALKFSSALDGDSRMSVNSGATVAVVACELIETSGRVDATSVVEVGGDVDVPIAV